MEKHDAEKPRLGLVVLGFARALQAVAHAAHVAWNALARLDLELRRVEK